MDALAKVQRLVELKEDEAIARAEAARIQAQLAQSSP